MQRHRAPAFEPNLGTAGDETNASNVPPPPGLGPNNAGFPPPPRQGPAPQAQSDPAQTVQPLIDAINADLKALGDNVQRELRRIEGLVSALMDGVRAAHYKQRMEFGEKYQGLVKTHNDLVQDYRFLYNSCLGMPGMAAHAQVEAGSQQYESQQYESQHLRLAQHQPRRESQPQYGLQQAEIFQAEEALHELSQALGELRGELSQPSSSQRDGIHFESGHGSQPSSSRRDGIHFERGHGNGSVADNSSATAQHRARFEDSGDLSPSSKFLAIQDREARASGTTAHNGYDVQKQDGNASDKENMAQASNTRGPSALDAQAGPDARSNDTASFAWKRRFSEAPAEKNTGDDPRKNQGRWSRE